MLSLFLHLRAYYTYIQFVLEVCCHVRAGASYTVLKALDRIRNGLSSLVGPNLFSTLQPLSRRRKVPSLALFSPPNFSLEWAIAVVIRQRQRLRLRRRNISAKAILVMRGF